MFANNRVSLALASNHPTGSLVGHWGGECSIAYLKLYETLANAEYGHSYEVQHAPFAYAWRDDPEFGENRSLFDWYAKHVCRCLVLNQLFLIIGKCVADRTGGKDSYHLS